MDEYSRITGRACSPREIVSFEATLLITLGFKVLTPMASEFLFLFQKANQCTDDHRYLANYLLESSLLCIELVCYKPSHLAAAALLLSNIFLNVVPSWPEAMHHYTGYRHKDLMPSAKILSIALNVARGGSLQAVRKKFSRARYNRICSRVDKMFQSGDRVLPEHS